jgi:tetratricopeptide (TPR) repeat protein
MNDTPQGKFFRFVDFRCATGHLAVVITACVVAILIVVPQIGCAAERLPRPLGGVWIREDDSFSGTIMEVDFGPEGPAGTLIFVNDDASGNGFKPGDVKLKSIKAVSESDYEALSLVKTAQDGHVTDAWYDAMVIYLRAQDELICRQKRGSSVRVGAWQRWVRLKASDSRFGDYLYGKGMIAARNHNWRKATELYQAALETNTSEPRYLNAVAWRLAVNPDPADRNAIIAKKYADSACKHTNFEEPSYVDTLAAAYAASGEFDEALQYQQRACRLQILPPNDYLGRLVLYRTRKPYVEGGAIEFDREAVWEAISQTPAGSPASNHE